MKRKVLVFILIAINSFLLKATDYKVMQKEGSCSVEKGKEWVLLNSNDIITENTSIKSVNGDAMIYISEDNGKNVIPIKFLNNEEVLLKKKLPSANVFSDFIDYLLSLFKKATIEYRADELAGVYKGISSQDSMMLSLCFKMKGREFEIDSIISEMSDYPVFLYVNETSSQNLILGNFSNDSLYVAIAVVSKVTHKITSLYDDDTLFQIAPESIAELPSKQLNTATYDYILFANKELFNVEYFFNDIHLSNGEDCDSEITTLIGIYRIK